MNSILERLNRTIIEHASAMLWSAKLPIGFWFCIVAVAVYTKNRSPTKALNTTPYEVWYGQVPNLGHLKIFGCRAVAYVPDELQVKLAWTAKSTECIFIGYSETENLYKLWDMINGDVVRKRDVIFFEGELGHELFENSTLQEGISIAGKMVETQQLPITPKDTPQNEIPLNPLPARQHVARLPEETQVQQHQFIQWNPTELQQRGRTLRRPNQVSEESLEGALILYVTDMKAQT